jgi:hypothetical protein
MTDRRPDRWRGKVGERDDFGQPYNGVMYDARISGRTAWANMSELSWRMFGVGQLGIGFGQRYELQPDGVWLRTEG